MASSARSALEDRRLFVLLPFAMVAGVAAYAVLPFDPSALVLGAVSATLAVAALAARSSLAGLRILALCAAAWAGFCLLPVHGGLFGTAMLGRPIYGSYSARVDEVLSDNGKERRVVVSDIAPMGNGNAVGVRRARVVVRGGPVLEPGDTIAASFRFSAVPGPVVPFGYDTQFHSYFDGIGAYATTTKPPAILKPGDGVLPARIVEGVRRDIAARIDAVLPQPAAGVARAIITGDQSMVTDETRTSMATAGIAHVLSVSGLHLTIVAGGVFWALRLALAGLASLASRMPAKPIAALGGIVSALTYFAISGGNIAAFRSTLMILLVFGAVLAGRRALTMRNVAIAGIVVTAFDPASIFRPSFQLSFAAVIALVGAYENLRSSSGKDASLIVHALGYIRGIVVTSLVAGAATLLFSVYHFQQTSPLGVAGNLLTLPLVGFVMMPAALVSVLAMPLGIEGPFLLTLGWSIDRMLDMARLVAGWSEHLRVSPLLTPTALIVGLGALAWFAFFRDRWRLLGPLAAIPLTIVFGLDSPPDVLVADTTRAVAIRGPDGLALADGKSKSFALEVWRQTYGDPIAATATSACDSLACIGESNTGFAYAIVRSPDAFADECGRADLIVARVPAPGWCSGSLVIDPSTLARDGVQWLRWNAGSHQFVRRSAIEGTGRAWRIRR